MAEGVREYIEGVDMTTYRKPTDKVEVHGKSPEVTRKLIHLIEWLCLRWYTPLKGDPMQFVYLLRLWHYQSLDVNGKVCILHADKILPNLKERLKNCRRPIANEQLASIIINLIRQSSTELINQVKKRLQLKLDSNYDD